MRPTIDELKSYYATADGQRVAGYLARRIAPVVRRDGRSRLLGLGYCAPLLAGLDPHAVERLAILMPFAQGVHRFPFQEPNCSCLTDELSLPFRDAMFDQAILCHALEFVEPPRLLLREMWRALAPHGEIILIVPNRTGVWTHFERVPFGNGRPFGRSQLEQILREAQFEPLNWTTALAAPPVRGLRWMDRALLKTMPRIGGVHLLLARKTTETLPRPVKSAAAAKTFRLPGIAPAPGLPSEVPAKHPVR